MDPTPTRLLVMQLEFENPETTRERRVELLTELRGYAEESGTCIHCVKCQSPIFYAPHDEGLIPGHVYSHDGFLEVTITGLCEVCFDEITRPLDDDDDDGDDTVLVTFSLN